MRESEPSIAFLRDLLHELKDPFAALHGGLDLCASVGGPEGEQRERLQSSLRRSSEQMKSVLEDASTYLRLLNSAPTPSQQSCELEALLEGVGKRLRPGLEGREQSLKVQAPELWFATDPEMLGRCLSCLLGSLSRAASAGSSWTLQADLTSEELAFVCRLEGPSGGGGGAEVGGEAVGGGEVGGSEAAEASPARADYRRLLAERLADALGATLQETPGRDWTLLLPFQAAAPAAPPLPLPSAFPTTSDRPRRVLVVDDNVDGADTMAMWLEAHDFEVATAYDGESGLAEYQRFLPDIGLFDVGLPRKNGYELAREVREAGFRGELLAITGYGQERDRAEALAAGFDHHLVKPVDLDRLSQLLEAARTSVQRPRVVVVEDNPLALNVVVRMLERLGASAVGCPSAEAGLAAISDGAPDLVLCDLGLPGGMDGFALAHLLRSGPETRSLRLLALTGDAAASTEQALAAGFERVLDKPIDEATLRGLLQAG